MEQIVFGLQVKIYLKMMMEKKEDLYKLLNLLNGLIKNHNRKKVLLKMIFMNMIL